MNSDPHNFQLSTYDLAMAQFFHNWGEVPLQSRTILGLVASWPANTTIKDKVGVIAYLHALADAMQLVQPDHNTLAHIVRLGTTLGPSDYQICDGDVGQYLVARNREGRAEWVWLFPE